MAFSEGRAAGFDSCTVRSTCSVECAAWALRASRSANKPTGVAEHVRNSDHGTEDVGFLAYFAGSMQPAAHQGMSMPYSSFSA